MKRAVLAILIVTAVAFAAGTLYAQAPPTTVTLAKAAKLGPVTFNHAAHAAMKANAACTACHTTEKGGKIKDGMFHPTKPAPSLTGGCIDCHKKPENVKAPKTCTGCHKKAA